MTNIPVTIQERIALPAGTGGRPREGVSAITATDILAMLRRRTVLIVVLFFIFSVLAMGGFVAKWSYFPLYRAEAMIECISNVPQSELSVQQERLRKDEHERFVLSQAIFLKSPSVLNSALKMTAVKDTNWYKSVAEGEHRLELEEELSAGPIRGTNYLRVAISCRKIKDPAVIVNAVVQIWHESVKKRSADAFASQLEGARTDKSKLEKQVAAKREHLQVLAGRMPPGAAMQQLNLTAQQVLQYGEQAALLELERAQLEQFRSVYNDPEGLGVTAEDRQMVEADPHIQMLANNVFGLEQRLAADSEMFGREHVETKQLQAALDAARAELEQLRTQKLLETRANLREAANTAYFNTQHALFVTQENLQKAEAALQDQDQLVFEYRNLEAEIEKDLLYLLDLTDYANSLERVVIQRTAMSVNITQQALDPLERSSPSLLMIPLGIFVALAFALGLGLAVELVDTSVRTPQDIVRHLDIAVLGVVPDIDDEEVAIEHVETAVRDAPRSMVAEAFRRVRTNLQFSAPAARQRTIMVTSPRPDDGKTSVACNLALVIAQSGRRVLLVDANFRRPGISSVFFNEGGGRGLSNILVGEGTLTSFVTPSGQPSLDILGSGPVPPNPAELLGSEPFGTFLEDAVSRYDHVIVDTAPVLLASDALVVGTAMDGAILVVRANENSRGVGRRATMLLADVNAHLFGAVLNAARVTRGGYFREQLRSYYDYQLESDAPSTSDADSSETETPATSDDKPSEEDKDDD